MYIDSKFCQKVTDLSEISEISSLMALSYPTPSACINPQLGDSYVVLLIRSLYDRSCFSLRSSTRRFRREGLPRYSSSTLTASAGLKPALMDVFIELVLGLLQ